LRYLDCLGVNAVELDEPLRCEVVEFDAHFLEQQVVEIVLRQYVTRSCKFAFGSHVAVAELFFGYFDFGFAVSVPDDFAPVNTAAVECAAIVEYYSLNADMLHL
jgi:hypothetical protein